MSTSPPTNPPPAETRLEGITSAWSSTDVATRYAAAENATRPFAALMVSLSTPLSTRKPDDAPVPIFDLACGTGAVEAEIYAAVSKDAWANVDILAGDISAPMLEYLSARAQREGWRGVETRVVDGRDLDLGALTARRAGLFAHAFVGFAVFVLPADTISRLAGVVAPGGSLAVSTWAKLPWFEVLAETYARMEDGPKLPSDEQLWASITNGRAWYEAEYVKAQLEEAGLQEIVVVQRKFNVDCGASDVFMTTMGFILGMLSKQWSEDVRERWLKEVAETMKGILIEQAGGADRHVFMEFEGIVGVGRKGA